MCKWVFWASLVAAHAGAPSGSVPHGQIQVTVLQQPQGLSWSCASFWEQLHPAARCKIGWFRPITLTYESSPTQGSQSSIVFLSSMQSSAVPYPMPWFTSLKPHRTAPGVLTTAAGAMLSSKSASLPGIRAAPTCPMTAWHMGASSGQPVNVGVLRGAASGSPPKCLAAHSLKDCCSNQQLTKWSDT